MPYRGREIILATYSLDRKGVPFEERIEAAVSGGFDGIGLGVAEYDRLRAAGLSPTRMQRMLHDAGVRIIEIEALHRWGRAGSPDVAAANTERLMLEMGEIFAPRHTQVIGPFDGTVADGARAFARLCEVAATVGLLVALEVLPYTNVRRLSDARAVVERAGCSNGGLCLDVWHHVRGGDDWAQLALIPPAQVTTIQVNDGPIQPADLDYFTDCVTNRLVPGTGEFDLDRFVGDLIATGTDAPISVEVLNPALWRRSPAEIGYILGNATRQMLDRISL